MKLLLEHGDFSQEAMAIHLLKKAVERCHKKKAILVNLWTALYRFSYYCVFLSTLVFPEWFQNDEPKFPFRNSPRRLVITVVICRQQFEAWSEFDVSYSILSSKQKRKDGKTNQADSDLKPRQPQRDSASYMKIVKKKKGKKKQRVIERYEQTKI